MQGSSGVRIEWVGMDELPEVLRSCARAEVALLGGVCGKMRSMKVESEGPHGCRLTCSCLDRRKVRVSRTTLGEALDAFGQVVSGQCQG